jgi:hypothetical protein
MTSGAATRHDGTRVMGRREGRSCRCRRAGWVAPSILACEGGAPMKQSFVTPQMSGAELAKRNAVTRPEPKVLWMPGYTGPAPWLGLLRRVQPVDRVASIAERTHLVEAQRFDRVAVLHLLYRVAVHEREVKVQVEQREEVRTRRPSEVAVHELRRPRRGGFSALRRQAEGRRRTENRMMLLSIVGVVALFALLAHLLSG